jgi:hypothetical protein
MLSVHIDGDKSNFITKGAIDRLKRDLKNDDKSKLEINDYFKEGWTFKLVSKSDTEIKVEIMKKDVVPLKNEVNEKRLMLKDKLKAMRSNRTSVTNLKSKMKNSSVPEDLLEAYMALKKVKLPVPILDPAEALAHPLEYKQQVYTMVQSFGFFNGKTNPIINYYRLLAQHMGLPTTVQPPVQPTVQPTVQESSPTINNSFIDELRTQRETLNLKVDDEMKNIYAKLGINNNDNNDSDEELNSILEKIPNLI